MHRHHDVLFDCHQVEQPNVLERTGHAQCRAPVRLQSGEVSPVKIDGAAARLIQPGQDVEECRFARAVGAYQAHYRPRRDTERHVADGDQATEADGDVVGVEDVLACFVNSRSQTHRWRVGSRSASFTAPSTAPAAARGQD